MVESTPTETGTEPLTFRLLVRTMFAAYRARFLRVAVPAICVLVPVSIVETLAEDLQHAYGHHPTGWVRYTVLAGAILAALAAELGLLFYTGLLDRLMGAYFAGENDPTVGQVLRALPWRRLLLAELVLAAAVILGFVLLIVPGLIIVTLFSIVGPLINMEDFRAFRAFRESARLVRPHFFLTFFAVTVPIFLESSIDDAIIVKVWERGFVAGLLVNSAIAILVLATVGLMQVVLAHQLVARDRAAGRGAQEEAAGSAA